MSYTKWIGGAVGWALGGPIGGVLGYWLGKMFSGDFEHRVGIIHRSVLTPVHRVALAELSPD